MMAAEINKTSATNNDLAAHEADLANPHQVKTVQLVDVDFTTPLEIGSGIVWTGADPAKPFEALNIWVVAAYGGVRLAAQTALPDVGIGWTTLEFDSGVLTSPRGVTQDTANSGLRINEEGIYMVDVSFTLEHSESNSGREIEVRVYNVDKAESGGGTVIGIGRNQPSTNFTTAIMAEAPANTIGDLLVIQIGNGDALTAVNQVSGAFSVHAVGEFRG